jgi:hypothetical protein
MDIIMTSAYEYYLICLFAKDKKISKKEVKDFMIDFEFDRSIIAKKMSQIRDLTNELRRLKK